MTLWKVTLAGKADGADRTAMPHFRKHICSSYA